MTPTATEWVTIAEEDFASANRDATALRKRSYRNACYHFHQCAKKYLKARLQEADIRFPKTHDLRMLLDMCLRVESLWETLRQHVNSLHEVANEIRYPGIVVDKEMARNAKKSCIAVRKLARESLGLA